MYTYVCMYCVWYDWEGFFFRRKIERVRRWLESSTEIVIGPGWWCSHFTFQSFPIPSRICERVRGSYRRETHRDRNQQHITARQRIIESRIVCRSGGKRIEKRRSHRSQRCYPQLPKDVLLLPLLHLDLIIPCCFPTSAESSRFRSLSLISRFRRFTSRSILRSNSCFYLSLSFPLLKCHCLNYPPYKPNCCSNPQCFGSKLNRFDCAVLIWRVR